MGRTQGRTLSWAGSRSDLSVPSFVAGVSREGILSRTAGELTTMSEWRVPAGVSDNRTSGPPEQVIERTLKHSVPSLLYRGNSTYFP